MFFLQDSVKDSVAALVYVSTRERPGHPVGKFDYSHTMALLKEDGSLDIERINKLPLNEFMDQMGDLTQEQVEEYISCLPITENNEPLQAIVVNSIEEYGEDADEFLNEMREKNGL